MKIVSDTNILSSFAASEALSLLPPLFVDPIILIPPAVFQELQDGLARDKTYLEAVLQAIAAKEIQVLELTVEERRIAQEGEVRSDDELQLPFLSEIDLFGAVRDIAYQFKIQERLAAF